MRFESEDSQIVEQLKHLHRSGGDFECSRNHCAPLRETWCHIVTPVVLRVP